MTYFWRLRSNLRFNLEPSYNVNAHIKLEISVSLHFLINTLLIWLVKWHNALGKKMSAKFNNHCTFLITSFLFSTSFECLCPYSFCVCGRTRIQIFSCHNMDNLLLKFVKYFCSLLYECSGEFYYSCSYTSKYWITIVPPFFLQIPLKKTPNWQNNPGEQHLPRPLPQAWLILLHPEM